VIGHAELSDEQPVPLYRWLLTRRWQSLQPLGSDGRPREPYALWIGLNPSTADGLKDDQTIRRIRGFCERLNLSGFAMANLFPGRATEPRDLYRMEDPIGPGDRGLKRLIDAARGAEFVVACWGAHERRASDWPRGQWSAANQPFELTMHGRASQVCQALAREGADLRCLGTTTRGHPRHPSRVRNDTELEPFDGLKRYPPERPMEVFCACGHSYRVHDYDRSEYARERKLAKARGEASVALSPEQFGACKGEVRPMVGWHRDERWRPLRCQCAQFRLPEPWDYVDGPPRDRPEGGRLILLQGGER
jgi:hypothetical protein